MLLYIRTDKLLNPISSFFYPIVHLIVAILCTSMQFNHRSLCFLSMNWTIFLEKNYTPLFYVSPPFPHTYGTCMVWKGGWGDIYNGGYTFLLFLLIKLHIPVILLIRKCLIRNIITPKLRTNAISTCIKGIWIENATDITGFF